MPEQPLTFKGKTVLFDEIGKTGMVYLPLVHKQAIIEVLKQLDGLKRTLHKLLNA